MRTKPTEDIYGGSVMKVKEQAAVWGLTDRQRGRNEVTALISSDHKQPNSRERSSLKSRYTHTEIAGAGELQGGGGGGESRSRKTQTTGLWNLSKHTCICFHLHTSSRYVLLMGNMPKLLRSRYPGLETSGSTGSRNICTFGHFCPKSGSTMPQWGVFHGLHQSPEPCPDPRAHPQGSPQVDKVYTWDPSIVNSTWPLRTGPGHPIPNPNSP